MNTKNEEKFNEEKEDSSVENNASASIEETEENEGFKEETLEEAEIIEDEEFEEIFESEVQKEMRQKTRKLEEENKKLQNELTAFKDKLLRTAAEYENFRKRTTKEKEGIYTDACEDVLKEVLPVLDNLERALSVQGSEEDLRKGVEMTVRQFEGAFTKLGVEELVSEGEFDPNFHNAVMHIQDEQHGTNEIVEVFQKGYKRGSKVLRYSMVKVAN